MSFLARHTFLAQVAAASLSFGAASCASSRFTSTSSRPMPDLSALEQAKQLIAEKKADAVLIRSGEIVSCASGHGLAPLFMLLNTHAREMKGSLVVDKVVGKAAACLCVKGGAHAVHGLLMSAHARDFLSAHQITATADELVPQILNRTHSGLCPMEEAVQHLTDVDEMIAALKVRLAALRGRK